MTANFDRSIMLKVEYGQAVVTNLTNRRSMELLEKKINRQKELFTIVYVMLIAYGSLFPFAGFIIPEGNPFGWMTKHPFNLVSRKDAVVNILAYIPLGFLLFKFTYYRCGFPNGMIRSFIAGLCLSLTMESLQGFLPGRDPSTVDLFTNSSGAAIGHTLAFLHERSTETGGAIKRFQKNWLAPGHVNSAGAVILLIWGFSALSPFVPTLSTPGPVRGVEPLLLTLLGKTPFDLTDALVHFSRGTGLAILAFTIFPREVRSIRLFAFYAMTVLTLQIFIINRYQSLEAVSGYIAGICMAALISLLAGNLSRIIAILLLMAGFVLSEVKADETTSIFREFNWIPFRYHLESTLSAISLILAGIWPFSAISLLCIKLSKTDRSGLLLCGGAVIFLVVALLEWEQQYIPGRTADITQALLAVIGWYWPLLLLKEESCSN